MPLDSDHRKRLNCPYMVYHLKSWCLVCFRYGRHHAHRRHENRPDRAAPAALAVVTTGMPADGPAIGYPEIYKAKDEEPERRECPVPRRHRHGHGKKRLGTPASVCLPADGRAWFAQTLCPSQL